MTLICFEVEGFASILLDMVLAEKNEVDHFVRLALKW